MGQGDDWEIATLGSRQTAAMSRIALSQIGEIGPKANMAAAGEGAGGRRESALVDLAEHQSVGVGSFFMPKKPAAPNKKAREPLYVEDSDRAKAHIRSGGIAHRRRDPLRRAPLREPYGARSGAPPEEQGTPESVTKTKSRSKTSGDRARRT